MTKFEVRDERPVLVLEPKLNFFTDYEGKLVGINKFLDRRPIAAFDNADGDLQMLEWVTDRIGQASGFLFTMMMPCASSHTTGIQPRESSTVALMKHLNAGGRLLV